MALLQTALDLILQILNIFTGNKKKQQDIEKAVKDATAVYEQTANIPSDVRESHQKLKSKLRQSWEQRWGNQKKEPLE